MKRLDEMHLVVASHKLCWRSESSPSGFVTDGGFPFQMSALSELFARTTLLLPCATAGAGAGLLPLSGNNLKVIPLPEPASTGISRKLGLLPWLLLTGRRLFASVRRADALHAPIPGDLGSIGMLLAFFMKKPLFVRHCGNWANQRTVAERLWRWFLERFAGGRNVVLATGGQALPPSRRNPNIHWIFSTSLTQGGLKDLRAAREVRDLGNPRLITVGRQEPFKRTDLLIAALPALRRRFPSLTLEVIGEGSALPALQRQASELGLEGIVEFPGRLAHVDALASLRRATVFALPSESEGFPKAVLEALAAGLPVVATDLPVLRSVLLDGGGVMLRGREAVHVEEAVTDCLSDPATYAQLSERAFEAARSFSLERWRDEIGGRLQGAWCDNA